MKMLSFKFQQNCTINEQSDFFEGKRGGDPHIQILISIIIGTHMKWLGIKFEQNRTLNEEFVSFEGERERRGSREGKEAPNHIFIL